jgi:2-polyprenyl-6-methoxyphenol hydroxylase-like FAD-dependent oxidoreductase
MPDVRLAQDPPFHCVHSACGRLVLCLCRAMRQKIPAGNFHSNCKVVAADLSDPSSSAVIELESGERIAGHLIIAADG